MSLWVDKYRPCSLGRLDYHKEQAAQLRNLVQCGDFPHLLVYGPSGAGKKTRIMCILRELYGVGVEKLRIEHQTITTPSKKKIEISTIASNYHLEVNPSDAGNSDRVVIQEMLKTVAQSQQLETHSQRDFKGEVYLRETANAIVSQQTPQRLLEVRGRLYELLTHCIPPEIIMKGLLLELLHNCDGQLKGEVAQMAAYYEHRLQLGSKAIYHLEAFVAKFMALYKKFMEDGLEGMMF
uniref:Replication factor C subunit 3 n=1 Tax=Cebus imitator TaxID=2715852 RepID=A0A2K5SJ27_CEBIM